MNDPASPIAILFADVCGSVELYDRLGDQTAAERIGEHLALLARIADRQGGEVVKTIGDAVMCTFPDAIAATVAAARMRSGRRPSAPPSETELRIRVGMHLGDTVQRDGDVFGDAVNIAARMAEVAGNGQVVTTAATVAGLPAVLQADFRALGPIYVKGKREELELYELVDDAADRTDVRPSPMAEAGHQAYLTLHHQGHRHRIDQTRPILSLGRSPDNDLVVSDPTASRHHARIELRAGTFWLVDQSSNGSHVTGPAYGNPRFCHRNELLLLGHGVITLGHPQANPNGDIHFVCADAEP